MRLIQPRRWGGQQHRDRERQRRERGGGLRAAGDEVTGTGGRAGAGEDLLTQSEPAESVPLDDRAAYTLPERAQVG
jgi:hypothetical protein